VSGPVLGMVDEVVRAGEATKLHVRRWPWRCSCGAAEMGLNLAWLMLIIDKMSSLDGGEKWENVRRNGELGATKGKWAWAKERVTDQHRHARPKTS
jgi:hypothetical protein